MLFNSSRLFLYSSGVSCELYHEIRLRYQILRPGLKIQDSFIYFLLPTKRKRKKSNTDLVAGKYEFKQCMGQFPWLTVIAFETDQGSHPEYVSLYKSLLLANKRTSKRHWGGHIIYLFLEKYFVVYAIMIVNSYFIFDSFIIIYLFMQTFECVLYARYYIHAQFWRYSSK